MTLSEIADGLEVTASQRDRGVAVADDTETPLVDRLAEHADELPCTPQWCRAFAPVIGVTPASRAASPTLRPAV